MADERKDLTGFDGNPVDSLPRWLRDVIDYNNETAGRETGRIKRFPSAARDDGPDSQAKKDERRFSELLRLLQNPLYAQLYSEAAHVVTDAEAAAVKVIRRLEQESELAAERVQNLRSAALELPDGRKVFRSNDGRYMTEDGQDVTARRGELPIVVEGSPNYEEFCRERDRLAELERQRQEIEEYERGVLDPARKRLSDADTPPSPDELREIIEKTKTAMPASVRSEYEAQALTKSSNAPASSAADTYLGETSIGSPPINSHFSAAILGLSEAAPQGQPAPAPKRT